MNAWLEQWYSAQATNGGVIRRSRNDVDHYASLGEVVDDAVERGWHVLETGGQVVVLCHAGEVVVHC